MIRALIAFLAFFFVGSAFAQSPEPAKIRITTWNLEWFPKGCLQDVAAMQQARPAIQERCANAQLGRHLAALRSLARQTVALPFYTLRYIALCCELACLTVCSCGFPFGFLTLTHCPSNRCNPTLTPFAIRHIRSFTGFSHLILLIVR
jgi:hypothetical protein